jgi:hypothetical protein
VGAGHLRARADALAETFEALDGAGWSRTGIYSWPTTAVRTVEWIGLHTVHECAHHLSDIGSLVSDDGGGGPGPGGRRPTTTIGTTATRTTTTEKG